MSESIKFKNFLKTILSLFFLLQAGCALNFYRNPATDLSNEDKSSALQGLLKFRSSNEILPSSVTHSTITSFLWDNYRLSSIFHFDSNLPPDVSYALEFQMNKGEGQIVIYHSQNAFEDGKAARELFEFLKQFKGANGVFKTSKHSMLEMYYNAYNGDPVALSNFARMRQKVASSLLDSDPLDNYFSENLIKWNQTAGLYEKLELIELKKQKKLEAVRKLALDALDSASEDQQFKTLVAKNDRIGVTELLKQYLPWEQMPPFEKKYWENYIEVVLNPLPIEERILLFRGLADDKLHPAYKDGIEIPIKQAEKEGNVFVLSTVLARNQGSWNRRLRSLTSMYNKSIASRTSLRNKKPDNSYTRSARIMTMMANHSSTPFGSPFLSLTHSYDVALGFALGKIGVYTIDPRMLAYNIASVSLAVNPKDMSDELEALIPLTIFPEDVGHVAILGVNTDNLSESALMENLKDKLTQKYGNKHGEFIFNRLRINTESFKKGVRDYKLNALINSPSEPKANLHKITSPSDILACIDIMKKFWK